MIRPSEMLRSLVASKSPDDLKHWVLLRLSGEDSMPMLYQGKEVEHPHEVVAVLFGLSTEVLTPEKREAVVAGLKQVRRVVSEAWVDGNSTSQQVEQARHWAEVVELGKPEELRNDARLFLEACMLAPDSPALPALAAAATAFVEPSGYDALFWNKLLENRNTAALAFRRLLGIAPFEQAAQHWVTLLKHRVNERWPTNIRLLVASLLDKSPPNLDPNLVLARLIDNAGLSREAEKELRPSKDVKVLKLLKEIGTFQTKQVYISFKKYKKLPPKGTGTWDARRYIASADFEVASTQPTLEDDSYLNLAKFLVEDWISNSDFSVDSYKEKKEPFLTRTYEQSENSACELKSPFNYAAGSAFRNTVFEVRNLIDSRSMPSSALIQVHKKHLRS